jgi:hypothetical protein
MSTKPSVAPDALEGAVESLEEIEKIVNRVRVLVDELDPVRSSDGETRDEIVRDALRYSLDGDIGMIGDHINDIRRTLKAGDGRRN